MHDHANVVVLSDEVAVVLFSIDNPLGQTVEIHSDYYDIVGKIIQFLVEAVILSIPDRFMT